MDPNDIPDSPEELESALAWSGEDYVDFVERRLGSAFSYGFLVAYDQSGRRHRIPFGGEMTREQIDALRSAFGDVRNMLGDVLDMSGGPE